MLISEKAISLEGKETGVSSLEQPDHFGEGPMLKERTRETETLSAMEIDQRIKNHLEHKAIEW